MAFSEEVKRLALKRALGRCECTSSLHAEENNARCHRTWDLELHHIVPVKEGGQDNLENCVVLCYQCRDRVHRYGKL